MKISWSMLLAASWIPQWIPTSNYWHAVFMYCVQDSLGFPDDVSTSGDVKDLIQGLLTEPSHRLSYDSIKSHQFFQTTNWDDLLSCKPQF